MASKTEKPMAAAYCTVVRPTNYLDRMFYIQHRVGAQSNIILSAHYASASDSGLKSLPREAVYSAVRSVVTEYPELSIIGLVQPLDSKGHQGLRLAALHEIDLETCVEFRDDDEPKATPEALECLHNEWDWTDEQFNPRQPWWKVVVLGGQEVVFVYHHIVCDGRFSQTFQRQLLAGLNSFDEHRDPVSRIIKIDPEAVRLEPEMEKFWVSTVSVFRVIHVFLTSMLVRLFWGGRLLFTDLPRAKPHGKSALIEALPEERTKTRIATLRISSARMRRIISACRERKANFAPLLLCMMLCTLACDYYPRAKVGISNCALDLRSLYPRGTESPRSAQLLQQAGGHRKFIWLERCRRIFHHQSWTQNDDGKVNAPKVDVDAAWQLVQEYRSALSKGFQADPSPHLVTLKAGNNVSGDLEEMMKSYFPVLGTHLNNSIQLSNLGVFATETSSGTWKIDDVNFSAATVNGNLSYNISLNVVGVEGGDTVVNASYEDGVLAEDMVYAILETTLERIDAIL
ncbi:alcohol acetyltransferase [Dactylonectria estremocensis]|uniref:Alcohol acetyltransferase n=1 Tax=Dactylonectria estremocensis TaxID=1079267 RepID=A0A9P9FH48_9HYPO|nr:alcohol acetyltransferase [Dactylonectria estremocensis]